MSIYTRTTTHIHVSGYTVSYDIKVSVAGEVVLGMRETLELGLYKGRRAKVGKVPATSDQIIRSYSISELSYDIHVCCMLVPTVLL